MQKSSFTDAYLFIVEVESDKIFIYSVWGTLNKTLHRELPNIAQKLKTQTTATNTEAFFDETITSYYSSFKGKIPDDELEKERANVKMPPPDDDDTPLPF